MRIDIELYEKMPKELQDLFELIHTNPDCPCYQLDRQSGILNKQAKCKSDNKSGWQTSYVGGKIKSPKERKLYLDIGGASRFFYVAKASRKERNRGLEEMKTKQTPRWNKGGKWTDDTTPSANNHPCVKPLKLMEYLVRLVTPPKGICLDPFAGSGTTLIACKKLGFNWIGIERESEYIKIARLRLQAQARPLI